MTNRAKSEFLSVVMRQLTIKKPLLNTDQHWVNRVERVPGGNYVELWFLTQGCSWNRQGGCTMCNYGRGPKRSVDEIVNSVRKGLEQIDIDVDELMVSPSGGMLDQREVPLEARRKIYALVREFPAKTFIIETRPETVTEESLAELVAAVPSKRLCVEIGLESSCSWVGRFCINRGHTPEQFASAIETIRRYGVATYGNVSLGNAFLSPTEAIEDAVRTIQWALELGVNSVVLFPLHVKPFTLLEYLFSFGQYNPPSLWSLVEVLKRSADHAGRVEIAWYRSYYDDKTKICLSPYTCPHCYSKVLSLLDRYRAEQSVEVINELDAIDCSCRALWREKIKQSPNTTLAERVFNTYVLLVERLGLEVWWAKHGARIQLDMATTASTLMDQDSH